MNKSGTWRTLFPELQDSNISTPRKKQISNAHLQSHLDDLFSSTPTHNQPKPPLKKHDKNQLSRENPLSQSMYIAPPKPTKKSNLNKMSRDNPLNSKAPAIKSVHIIRSKITESKIAYLPASKLEKTPPRVIKTQNSETHFDFLPGSHYAKALPVRKPLTKVLNKETKQSTATTSKPNCKKLQANKLSNSFYISAQFV